MFNLTKKQQEIADLIINKQKELGKNLYIVYINTMKKTFLVELTEVLEDKISYNRVAEVSTRIVYSLLDKKVIMPKKINNDISLVALADSFN